MRVSGSERATGAERAAKRVPASDGAGESEARSPSDEIGSHMNHPDMLAHGFQVLEPDSELLYLHTASYTPSAEGGVRFDDAALNLPWPLPVTDLSERDKKHPLLNKNFLGINL